MRASVTLATADSPGSVSHDVSDPGLAGLEVLVGALVEHDPCARAGRRRHRRVVLRPDPHPPPRDGVGLPTDSPLLPMTRTGRHDVPVPSLAKPRATSSRWCTGSWTM